MNDKEFDVLLIYNMKDGENAEVFASKLTDAGLRVWFDQWQMIPGSLWTKPTSRR